MRTICLRTRRLVGSFTDRLEFDYGRAQILSMRIMNWSMWWFTKRRWLRSELVNQRSPKSGLTRVYFPATNIPFIAVCEWLEAVSAASRYGTALVLCLGAGHGGLGVGLAVPAHKRHQRSNLEFFATEARNTMLPGKARQQSTHIPRPSWQDFPCEDPLERS
jgi:hypothetical protein